MIRATTPTHKFIFPEILPVDALRKIQITYSQIQDEYCGRKSKIILEKNLDELTIDSENNTVIAKFTQEEMNKFHEGVTEIQVRAKRGNNQVIASQILKVKVKKILNKEIL